MDELDRSVADIILSSTRKKLDIKNIAPDSSHNLARFILKTACTFVSTDLPARRHIPKDIYERMPNPSFLPDGFLAFSANVEYTKKYAVGASSLDRWYLPDYQESLFMGPTTSRLKFGIQYESLVLGCCYLAPYSPIFIGQQNIHYPILTKSARFVSKRETLTKTLAPNIDPLPLNIVLQLINAELRRPGGVVRKIFDKLGFIARTSFKKKPGLGGER